MKLTPILEVEEEKADALVRSYWNRGRFRPTVVSVVVADGRVLVVRQHGFWALPQGGIQEGESVVLASQREVREETGCEGRLSVLAVLSPQEILFPPNRKPRDGFRGGKVYFPCVMGAEGNLDLKPNFKEVQDAGWFSLDEAKNLLTTDSFQAHKAHLVLAILAFVNANFSRIEGRR